MSNERYAAAKLIKQFCVEYNIRETRQLRDCHVRQQYGDDILRRLLPVYMVQNSVEVIVIQVITSPTFRVTRHLPFSLHQFIALTNSRYGK